MIQSYATYQKNNFRHMKKHCGYVNCNEFHKHERLFMIMVQQVSKSWNVSLILSEYVPQLSKRAEKIAKYKELTFAYDLSIVFWR